MPKIAKAKKTVANVAKKAGAKKKPKRTEPVWLGPDEGGVTQSLLGSFLCCRERFRIRTVEGLTEADHFKHAIEYGNMWHACEEAFAANEDWEAVLKTEALKLCAKYPLERPKVEKWYQVCRRQFPVYIEYWKKHPDVKNRTPIFQEKEFRVPYRLPGSLRTVTLRGKWDSVDVIGNGRRAGIYLQENKTKGDINEEQLQRQLQFDLQTMFYLTALTTYTKEQGPLSEEADGVPVKGVRYNVIRRPLSGGKGSIKQLQPSKKNPAGETADHYYDRLRDDYLVPEPEYWFMRWSVDISRADIDAFCRTFLNPVLEQLCDWWEWIASEPEDIYLDSVHWRHPFGVYNPMDLGRIGELDEYLRTGDNVGLEFSADMFPELEEK